MSCSRHSIRPPAKRRMRSDWSTVLPLSPTHCVLRRLSLPLQCVRGLTVVGEVQLQWQSLRRVRDDQWIRRTVLQMQRSRTVHSKRAATSALAG